MKCLNVPFNITFLFFWGFFYLCDQVEWNPTVHLKSSLLLELQILATYLVALSGEALKKGGATTSAVPMVSFGNDLMFHFLSSLSAVLI